MKRRWGKMGRGRTFIHNGSGPCCLRLLVCRGSGFLATASAMTIPRPLLPLQNMRGCSGETFFKRLGRLDVIQSINTARQIETKWIWDLAVAEHPDMYHDSRHQHLPSVVIGA